MDRREPHMLSHTYSLELQNGFAATTPYHVTFFLEWQLTQH